MARLPVPGSDDGDWGDILNDYLRQIHTEGGLLKDSVVAETNLSVGVQNKLNALASVTDGKEIELRNSSGFIQWRYLGGSEASWTNLVALGDLTGPAGAVGPAGPQGEIGPVGPQGPTGAVGPQGEVGLQGEVGPMGATGPIGPKGDKGDQGDPGTPGTDGVSPATPNFSASATTLVSGTPATASVSGVYPDLNIDLGIPQGEAGMHFIFRPGWFDAGFTMDTGQNADFNTLQFAPIFIPWECSVTSLAFRTFDESLDSTVLTGLYTNKISTTGDSPGNLIIAGNPISSLGPAGVKTVDVTPANIPSGLYWTAVHVSGLTAFRINKTSHTTAPFFNGIKLPQFFALGSSITQYNAGTGVSYTGANLPASAPTSNWGRWVSYLSLLVDSPI